jgi:hypothetical protein
VRTARSYDQRLEMTSKEIAGRFGFPAYLELLVPALLSVGDEPKFVPTGGHDWDWYLEEARLLDTELMLAKSRG